MNALIKFHIIFNPIWSVILQLIVILFKTLDLICSRIDSPRWSNKKFDPILVKISHLKSIFNHKFKRKFSIQTNHTAHLLKEILHPFYLHGIYLLLWCLCNASLYMRHNENFYEYDKILWHISTDIRSLTQGFSHTYRYSCWNEFVLCYTTQSCVRANALGEKNSRISRVFYLFNDLINCCAYFNMYTTYAAKFSHFKIL